jgi:predicted secreted protein
MRNILLGAICIIPSLLFSYELEFNKSFSKDIQNDKLHTNISINVNSKEVIFINEKIEFFQDFINEDSLVTKKDGSYSLLPKYTYQNNKQKFVGYIGSLSYGIETPKYEKLNQFITDLNSIRNNMNTNNVQLSVSSTQWIVSKELYKKNIDDMRMESIQWIKNYTKNIDNTCIVKNIAINKSNGYRIQRYEKNVMSGSPSSINASPSQTKQSIELNAHYKLECK